MKNTLKAVGLTTALFVGSLTLINCGRNHNKTKLSESGSVIMKKISGPTSHTVVVLGQVNTGAITVSDYPLIDEVLKGTYYYVDYDRDGLVDVDLVSSLYREKDFAENKTFFEDADREYLKELRRFDLTYLLQEK